jgi:methyl-accepting chemotaxis protein
MIGRVQGDTESVVLAMHVNSQRVAQTLSIAEQAGIALAKPGAALQVLSDFSAGFVARPPPGHCS